MLKLKIINKLTKRSLTMMRTFFANKMVCGAVLSLFALCFACNIAEGNLLLAGHSLFQPQQSSTVAHGPMLPPDPWAGTVTKPITIAHGPMLPPDPWAGTVTKPIAA
jgi:hypothetical protein